jgi:hypothetical protein
MIALRCQRAHCRERGDHLQGAYRLVVRTESSQREAIRTQLLTGVPAILEMHAHTSAQGRFDAELNTAIEEPGQGGQSIANHGGKLSIVEARQRMLFITMSDRRQRYASSQLTLRQGFDVMLKRVAP